MKLTFIGILKFVAVARGKRRKSDSGIEVCFGSLLLVNMLSGDIGNSLVHIFNSFGKIL